jgi:hypothetical protein
LLGLFFDPEDGGDMFQWTTRRYILEDSTLQTLEDYQRLGELGSCNLRAGDGGIGFLLNMSHPYQTTRRHIPEKHILINAYLLHSYIFLRNLKEQYMFRARLEFQWTGRDKNGFHTIHIF